MLKCECVSIERVPACGGWSGRSLGRASNNLTTPSESAASTSHRRATTRSSEGHREERGARATATVYSDNCVSLAFDYLTRILVFRRPVFWSALVPPLWPAAAHRCRAGSVVLTTSERVQDGAWSIGNDNSSTSVSPCSLNQTSACDALLTLAVVPWRAARRSESARSPRPGCVAAACGSSATSATRLHGRRSRTSSTATNACSASSGMVSRQARTCRSVSRAQLSIPHTRGSHLLELRRTVCSLALTRRLHRRWRL